MFVSLECKHTLLARVKILMNQHPQIILLRVAFNSFHTQLAFGIALTQVQNFALGLMELHKVHVGSALQLSSCLRSIWMASLPCQLHHASCDIGKLSEGNSILLSMSPAKMLKSANPNPEEHWSIFGYQTTDQISLSTTTQPIPYPPNGPSFESCLSGLTTKMS